MRQVEILFLLVVDPRYPSMSGIRYRPHLNNFVLDRVRENSQIGDLKLNRVAI